MRVTLDVNSMADYATFLKIKSLPAYQIKGRTATFPDQYADLVGMKSPSQRFVNYEPSDFLFDYQRDITKLAIKKRKFALFMDCGLGKTLIYAEFIRAAMQVLPSDKAVLIISPFMVVQQTLDEFKRFYGDGFQVEQVRAAGLGEWLNRGDSRIGITNFEALTDELEPGRLGCIVVDESSMLKSHYGKWGRTILRLGAGLDWKLAGTGTPAPNDRIEYANHAVFLDAEPNVNAFLARYFVNRGQTSERWALKAHALEPFYRSLSHWCIFLTNPATYGWKDHAEDIPPIHVNIHNVAMTTDQHAAVRDLTGQLFVTHVGGIGQRSKFGQISKGQHNGIAIDTNKPAYIRALVDSWPDESTIIWCIYNAEQDLMEKTFPEAASMRGATPYDQRAAMIDDFKSGKIKVLVSKPKILGFGLNLQVVTRQVFSGLQDSYESYYQAVKRSNRVGSTRDLNVHIPYTDAEYPMIQTVLNKADRVQADAEEQERIFKSHAIV